MRQKEHKRITLHPIKPDGTLDRDINLYPKTLVDGVVDRDGNEVNIATQEELDTAIAAVNTKFDDAVADLEARKQDNLISGENIKTINGESILGEGNLDNFVNLTSDQEIEGIKDFKNPTYMLSICPTGLIHREAFRFLETGETKSRTIIPFEPNEYDEGFDLGSEERPWRHLYLSGNADIEGDIEVTGNTQIDGAFTVGTKIDNEQATQLNGSLEINNQDTGFYISGGKVDSKGLDIHTNFTVGDIDNSGSIEIKSKNNLVINGTDTINDQTITFTGTTTFQDGIYSSIKDTPNNYTITVGSNTFDVVTRSGDQYIDGEKTFNNDILIQSPVYDGHRTIYKINANEFEFGKQLEILADHDGNGFTNSTHLIIDTIATNGIYSQGTV